MPENGGPLGIAVKSSHKDPAQAVQTAMRELRKSGELPAIFKNHGLTLAAL